jgi:hypothetical protein
MQARQEVQHRKLGIVESIKGIFVAFNKLARGGIGHCGGSMVPKPL